MARLLPFDGRSSEEATDADETGRELTLRTAVLGAGAVAVGFLLGRRLLGSSRPGSENLRERAGDALPGDGVAVPIGDSADEESEDEAAVAGADPSLEEVDERTQADVKSEPAEPGEMQIDEDLVEEATDDEGGEEDEAE